MFLILLIIILIIVVGWWVATYNNFQSLITNVEESSSQIDVQLKRRADLIPNLVNTVKGYAKHEKETLTAVIKARQQIINLDMSKATPQQKIDISSHLSQALKSLFAVSERYPELKADQNFISLQEELTNTENKISYSRQLYNSCVAELNKKIRTFPSSIVAKHYSIKLHKYIEVPEEEKKVPTVQF